MERPIVSGLYKSKINFEPEVMMNFVALEKELDRVSRQLSLSADLTDSRFLEIKAEIDEMKLEIAALYKFLEETLPDHARDLPGIRERTFRDINPEMGPAGRLGTGED